MNTFDMLRLHAAGKSFSEIARQAGVSRAAVISRVNRQQIRDGERVRRERPYMEPPSGVAITDPWRPDRALRRFSWEGDHPWRGTGL